MTNLFKEAKLRGVGYVGGIGPMNPELMIVGQSIGKHERESGIPFSGPAGNLLDEILEVCGISRREVYLTNVLKYQPNTEIKLAKWDDDDSVERLWEEIDKINPRKIIALGAIPLFFLTGKSGINEHRGSILKSQRCNKLVVPTYNPAHLLWQQSGEVQGWWQKWLIEFDIKRAKKLSTDWQAPYRNLHVANSSADLYRFFNRNRGPFACDIETIHTLPGCISFSAKKWEAISVPLFQQIGGIQICSIPRIDLAEIWRLVDRVLREEEIDGQNFKFDQGRLEELPFRVLRFRSDTMLKAFVLNPEFPKSQAFLASILTEEPYYKDEGKDFNPKKDDIKRWLLYNAKDSAVCREISDVQDADLREEGLYDYYYGYYHNLHRFYYEMENIGLCVDEAQRQKLIVKYTEMLSEVNSRLQSALGWLPKSVAGNSKDLYLAVYETLRMPKRESLDEETLVALGANTAKTDNQRTALQCIIERRRLEKILGPDRLRFRCDWDGKARTSYRITGTETGRSSTAILKQPVRLTKIGLGFQTMSKHGDVGKDFRSMFVPPPGMVFINVDQSQAEARIVALLSEDYDLLELFDTVDIHRFTAAIGADYAITRKANTARKAIELKDEVNRAIEKISTEERFIGKTNRHAGNLGMSKRRFMLTTNTDAKKFHIDVQISEYKAGILLDRFHKFSPKIKEVFWAGIEHEVNQSRELRRPDGSIRVFFDRFGPDLYREAYADIPQHTVANQTKRAGLSLKKEIPEIPIVLEAHDALVVQWWEKEAEDVARLLSGFMSRPIDFVDCSLKRGRIVIPSDIEIGYNYADLKKRKDLK